jgi:hypothetical protein
MSDHLQARPWVVVTVYGPVVNVYAAVDETDARRIKREFVKHEKECSPGKFPLKVYPRRIHAHSGPVNVHEEVVEEWGFRNPYDDKTVNTGFRSEEDIRQWLGTTALAAGCKPVLVRRTRTQVEELAQ